MAAESTTRRRKVSASEENATKGDKISALPDSLLSHILSFLSAKQAVATSILSKRWRSVWTSIPNLDFDNDLKHFNVIYRVLLQTESNSIRSFRISCRDLSFDPSDVTSWVSTAIRRKVEKLHLSLILKQTFSWPRSFYSCETIVELKLVGNFNLNVPTSVYLPSLKKLSLTRVIYAKDAFDVLLSGCPVLEDLSAQTECDFAWKTCPLALKNCSIEFVRCKGGDNYKLDINASAIQCFALTGKLSGDNYHIRNTNSLVEAKFDVFADEVDTRHLVRLLGSLRQAKILLLSSATTWSLRRVSIVNLPKFHNIKCLELTVEVCDLHLALGLLHKCHRLEVLLIETRHISAYNLNWKQPSGVPDCLSSNLIMCEFRGYRGSKYELGFAEYILKRGTILNMMRIHASIQLKTEEKLYIVKELCLIPRGSNACQLAFD